MLLVDGRSGVARAQQHPPAEPTLEEDLARRPDESEHGLGQAVIDPTAPLAQIGVIVEHDPSYHGPEDVDVTTLIVRAAIPFTTWGIEQLARVSVPSRSTQPRAGRVSARRSCSISCCSLWVRDASGWDRC